MMSLTTFTLFEYGKKGDRSSVEHSNKMVSNLKACRVGFLDGYLKEIKSEHKGNQLESHISSSSILIPIPKSAPLLIPTAQWPAREICKVLLQNGFGGDALALIKRERAVPKAAFQKSSEARPSVQIHLESLSIDKSVKPLNSLVEDIVLVDDVVTQGRTAMACYQLIMEEFKSASIKLFCPFRTVMNEIDQWDKPKMGVINYYESGKTFHRIDTAEDDFEGFFI